MPLIVGIVLVLVGEVLVLVLEATVLETSLIFSDHFIAFYWSYWSHFSRHTALKDEKSPVMHKTAETKDQTG